MNSPVIRSHKEHMTLAQSSCHSICKLMAITMLALSTLVLGARGARAENWTTKAKNKANELQERSREAAENATRIAEDNVRRAQEQTRNSLDQAGQGLHEGLTDHGNRLERISDELIQREMPHISGASLTALRDVTMEMSRARQNQIIDIYRMHGENVGNDVTGALAKFGPEIGGRIMDAYGRHGTIGGEMMRTAFDRYGQDAGEQMGHLLRAAGVETATRANALASRYGAGVLTDLCFAADLAESELSARILDVYEKHGQAVGGRLVEGLRAHSARGRAWFDDRILTVSQSAAAVAAGVYLDHGAEYAGMFLNQCERFGYPLASRMGPAFNQLVPAAQAATGEGLDAEQVVAAALTAYAFENEIDAQKKAVTLSALRLLTENVPVQTPDGRVLSLHDYSTEWIEAKAPYLKGTAIANDPEMALVYGVVYCDEEYLTQELRVIPDQNGGYVSLAEALYSSAPGGSTNTLEVIAALDAATTLASGTAERDDIYASALLYTASVNTLASVEGGTR